MHDKATSVKSQEKNGSNNVDPINVPVTEIPRRTPEILPTTSTTGRIKNDNPVWFSDLKTKLANANPNLKGTNLVHPTANVHLEPSSTTMTQSVANKGGIPVQLGANRIPTHAPVFQRQRVLGVSGIQTNAAPRSRVQYTANQRQNNVGFNRPQYNNPSSLRKTLQSSQLYQSSNPQVAPGYARAPNPYQWPGNQAWQGNRVQGNWGRGYSPPSYPSDQLDIGRRKREIQDSKIREKRQNTLWYTSRQYPSQMNYLANQRGIPSTSYQQPRNYFQQQQNSYQSLPNQAAASPYQRGYLQRASYGQSLGMGRSPAGQQSQGLPAPNSRSQIKTAPGYGTQPRIVAGGNPAPVERWPTLGNPIQKPTLHSSQNSVNSVNPSSRSRFELTHQNPTKNAQISQTTHRVVLAKPTGKVTKKLPMVHPIPKQKDTSMHSGSKNVGPQKDLSKKLQDMSVPAPHAKPQVKATLPSIRRNEKHVVPMFGGDILLSVGILQLLQKFTHFSQSRITERDLKVRMNTDIKPNNMCITTALLALKKFE